jgi:L-alanine-DL-glutamate epimerase-like enolase superfamily enzyme
VRGIPTLASQRRQLVTAISAIDIAVWDLMGKATQRPVHQLLGGALRSRVPAYVTGFYYRDGERPDDLRREAAMYLEHGYRTVKVKVAGLPPEADAERVGIIRKAVGDDVAIMLDANQGWNLPSAVRTAKLCEPYNIFWLEDPMPWYDERHSLRRLKAEVDIPISAGETEFTPFGLRTMVAEGLVDYLIIDSTWAGGLTVWRKAAVMAELYQIPMAAHHDPQIHVHAVAASPTGFILESFADHTRDPLWFELFRERPEIVDGYMAVPDTPGLGLELREETPREVRREARLITPDRAPAICRARILMPTRSAPRRRRSSHRRERGAMGSGKSQVQAVVDRMLQLTRKTGGRQQ